MSSIIPFIPKQIDPLTEHLQNLQPEQVDALQMMRAVYSNQIELSTALVSIQRHAIDTHSDIHELADSVACNALPQLETIANEMEKEL